MVRPLMGTKLYVPRPRPGLVTRQRLLGMLRGGALARLTLVSAPAGFGKTTLLADWVQGETSAGRDVAWVSLDAADNEPTTFWTYVVTALHDAVADVGSGMLEGLASGTPPSEAMLTIWLNELAEAPADVWLVLDDYHVVEDQDVRDSMTFFLEHLPPTVHVLVSTRADPDLPLPRWRVRGELVEIRASDLRFTTDEASAYLNSSAELGLSSQDVEVLEERTEGWIAALQLAALSIRGRADVGGFIARFAGTDRYVVDYLVEEVLAHQPAELRDFLLRTAVLDRLTGPLCDALTDRDDGEGTLDHLERANLFLVPLDDRRQWYRYHHLFADVLRARLLAEQSDVVPLLHERASDWYEQHHLEQDAIRHAFAAQGFDRAARLVELAIPAMRRHRNEALLLGWLDKLPDDVIRNSPVLSVFYGHRLLVAGDLPAVEARLDDAERALAAFPAGSSHPWADTDELRTLPATIAIYRASVAQGRGDVAGTEEHARRALDLAGPHDHLARGGAAGFLGLAAWAQGDVAGALDTFTQAVASLHAAGNLVDELGGTIVLADLSLAAGRPRKARRLYEDALQRAEAAGESVARATADLLVGLGEVDLEGGDLVGAKRHLERSAALGERAGMAEHQYRWFVAMSRVVEAEGDPTAAIGLLGHAEQAYQAGFFPDVRPIAAIRARAWIRQGDLSQAAEWARERGVSVTDEVSYLSEFDHLTLVRLLLATHRARPGAGTVDAVDQVMDMLGRLHEAAATAGRAGSLIETDMLRALALDARGDRTKSREVLGRTWAHVPEPEGYARLFLDEGVTMRDLLGDAVHQGIEAGHARRLLSLDAAPDQAAGEGRRQKSAPVESLSERELQVLRLLDSDLSGPQIARQLFVSHNTLRTHTKHIFTKLDVTSRRAAVSRARERGLL